MNILEAVRKANPMNEVVRLFDTLKQNKRIDPERAVRNWTPDLRVNALAEVVMEIVERVDKMGEPVEAMLVESGAPLNVVTLDDLSAVVNEVNGLKDRLDYVVRELETLKTKPCECTEGKTDDTNDASDTEAEPKKRGRKPAQ